MKTADLLQDTEKLSHTPDYPSTAAYFLHVTDKLSHNTEYPAKTIDLQPVTDKLSCKPVNTEIKVITKLPNSEQSYKGKVQTHNYINRQNQSTTGKL